MIFSPLRQWIEIVKDLRKSRKNARIYKAIAKAGSPDRNVRNLISVKIPAGKRLYFVNVNSTKDEIKYLSLTEIINIGMKNQKTQHINIYEEYIKEFKEAIDFVLFNTDILKSNKIITENKFSHYEKTYKKWEDDEEIKLKGSYLQGKSIKELSQIFQRRPGAIRSRLRKLGLID